MIEVNNISKEELLVITNRRISKFVDAVESDDNFTAADLAYRLCEFLAANTDEDVSELAEAINASLRAGNNLDAVDHFRHASFRFLAIKA